MRFCFVLSFCIVLFNLSKAQDTLKIPLKHSVYDSWKDISEYKISNNGMWASYIIAPQKGDGFLYLRNLENGTIDSVPRGSRAVFSPDNHYLAFRITCQEDTIRKMKIDKVKKDKMPKDSLGILLFDRDTIIRFSRVKSFTLADTLSPWMAVHFEKEQAGKKKKETEADMDKPKKKSKKELELLMKQDEQKKKKEEKEKKQEGTVFALLNPLTGEEHMFSNIEDFDFSDNGKLAGFISHIKDTVDTACVMVFNTLSGKAD
ncbi:MAG: hypothetical protein ABIJ16_06075, partial [Bacteroidota bacterium]